MNWRSILSPSLFVGWVLVYILRPSTAVLMSVLGHNVLYGKFSSCKCLTMRKCGFVIPRHSYLTATVYIVRLRFGNKRKELLQRSETPSQPVNRRIFRLCYHLRNWRLPEHMLL